MSSPDVIIIDFNNDSWVHVPGDPIVVDFGTSGVGCPDQWVYVPGYDVNFDLSTEWTPVESHQVNFDFVCEDAPPPIVYLNHNDSWFGHTVEWVLSSYQFLDQNAWHGAYGSSVLDDFPASPIPGNAWHGHYANVTLFTEVSLSLDSWHGHVSVSGLNVQFALDQNARHGHYSDSDIQDFPSVLLGADGYHGHLVDSDLDVSQVHYLDQDASHGHYSDSDLEILTYTFLGHGDSYHGAWVSALLSTTVLLDFDVWHGHFANSVLNENPQWTPTFPAWHGHVSDSILSGDTDLDSQGWHGHYGSSILQDYPQWSMEWDSCHGHYAISQISTDNILWSFGYHGHYATSILEGNPVPYLTGLDAWFGIHSNGSMSAAYNVGGNAWHGSFGETLLDEEPYHNAYHGHFADSEVSTDSILDSEGYYGHLTTFDLRIGPSEPLGRFWAYSGSASDSTLFLVRTAVLFHNPVKFGHHARFGFENGDTWNVGGFADIHLQNAGACCPNNAYHDPQVIDLGNEPPYDQDFSGNRGQAFAFGEITTAPRFIFQASHGSYSHVSGHIDEFDGWHGHFASCHITDETLNIRLCEGNFIPDSNSMVIEFANLYDENCESEYARHGHFAHCVIEYHQNAQAAFWHGHYSISDLTIDPILIARTFHGHHARFEFPMEFRASHGHYTRSTLPGDIFLAYGGHVSTMVDLTTEYFVEFEEEGCLENEYIPQDEQGDPVWEEFRPVPTETDEYYHQIKVKCY